MVDTTNKLFEKPAYNDYAANPTGWTDAVNTNWDEIDAAFGGVTNLNVTAQSGTVVLTTDQYRPLMLNVTGVLTANVTYQIPSGKGGQWIVINGTTGSFTLKISSGGAGTEATITQGQTTTVFCDGANVGLNYNTTIPDNSITDAKLAQIATQRLKGRATAGTGNVETITISQALDFISSTQGSLAFRDSANWAALGPGTAGQILRSGGAGANPSWIDNDPFPTQSGNSGKLLTTDGTSVSWSANSRIFARCTVTNGFSSTCSGAGIVNVTSITQSGGTYTVTFTNAAADTNYQVVATITGQGASLRTIVRSVSKSTGSFVIVMGPGNVTSFEPCSSFDFVVYPAP